MQAQTESTEQPAGDHAPGEVRGRSHLFTVRLWKLEAAGAPAYRGSVREAAGGAFRNFREWADLVAFLMERVEEDESRQNDMNANISPSRQS